MDREPATVEARPTTEMTDQPAEGLRIRHETHDRLLIAAFAADDLTGADAARAAALAGACPACAELVVELRSIAAATRRLPATVSVPRDFRLSPADAARLRDGGWRRVLRVRVERRWNTRPFAATLTTLGVAGLLLAAMPFMSLGPATGGTATRDEAATSAGPKSATSAMPVAAPTVTVGPVRNLDAAGSPGASLPGEFGALPLAPSSSAACCATQAPAAVVSTPLASPVPEGRAPSTAPQIAWSVPVAIVSLACLLVGLWLLVNGARSARRR